MGGMMMIERNFIAVTRLNILKHFLEIPKFQGFQTYGFHTNSVADSLLLSEYMLNQASRHREVLRSGGILPRILDLGTMRT
jgi:hypothetical protein